MATHEIDINMAPAHPGSFIRAEIVEELDLTISKTADILGVRRATLSDLLNEKAALSAEMALRVEKAFGLDMDTMLRMQAWHDAYRVRQRAGDIAVERYQVKG